MATYGLGTVLGTLGFAHPTEPIAAPALLQHAGSACGCAACGAIRAPPDGGQEPLLSDRAAL